MGILSWIVVGIIASWLTGEVIRGSGFGLFGDTVVGVTGAVIGGALASVLFRVPDSLSGVSAVSLAIAFLGSVLLITILRVRKGSRV